MRTSLHRVVVALVLFVAVDGAYADPAAAPGWSRGQQTLPLKYDECVKRMANALTALGYRRDDQPGGNFVVGIKNPHMAMIICGPAPDGKMLVQTVVASNGDGGGHERTCLQAEMEKPGSDPTCRASTDAGTGPAFVWQRLDKADDCSGHDQGESTGTTPEASKAKDGLIAVCWDGKTYNNTYASNNGRAFCTYKALTPEQCTGGSNKGVMWRAVRR